MQHSNLDKRRAFTMLELIFVIVILGIVSSIGSSIIVQVYEGYIIQKAVHNASIKTELAINQLANRLSYRIDMSMIARKPGETGLTVGTHIYPAAELPYADKNAYDALEWIGYDNDSFIWEKSDNSSVGWSGFADLDDSSFSTLHTPGTGNANINPIIKHYTGTTDGSGGALYFMGVSNWKNNGIGAIESYSTLCMHNNLGCMFPVTTGNQLFTFTIGGSRASTQMIYSELYQYATSAFAVVPESRGTGRLYAGGPKVWDLKFYYGYQPWQGENYKDGKDAILLKNVSVFRFSKEKNSIRIKICVLERIGEESQVNICKEKAVIR